MNCTEDQIDSLESSIEHWILSNEQDALNTFGENLVEVVKEILDEK